MADKTPLGKLIEHINLNGFPKNELQIKEFDDLLTTLLPEEKQAIVDAHIAGQKFAFDNDNHDSEEYFTQKYKA